MLRKLMNYIRQCRCQHEFEIETFEVYRSKSQIGWLHGDTKHDRIKTNELVYMRCKKCGYHTSHYKMEK
jgi:hypothetical protein